MLPAHEIQLVNYLTIAEIDNGLLINFGAAERLEIKRKYRVIILIFNVYAIGESISLKSMSFKRIESMSL